MQGRQASITRMSRCWRVALAFPVCVSILVMTLNGCGSLTRVILKPEVKRVTMNVVGMDFEKADLMFDVEVENSGSTSVTIAGYDYDLEVEGQPFLSGMSHDSFQLKPNAVTLVQVPISIELHELFKQVGLLMTRSEVSYNLAVAMTVESPVGAFRMPFQKEGTISSYGDS